MSAVTVRRPAVGLAVAIAAAVGVAPATGPAGAETVNWNAVAQCESGGNWAANNGGGLQIEPSTWAANGGVGLPAQASEQDQIAVANRILATQGPGAWPTCLGGGLGGVTGIAPVGSLTHLLTSLLGGSI